MPSLTHLTVRGFKSIAALERFELGSLNVLIGPNGAGKSNLLDVFRMLAAIAGHRLQVFVAQQDGPDAILFRGRKHTSELEVVCEFGAQKYAIKLECAGERMVFGREEARFGSRAKVWEGGHEESRLNGADWSEDDSVSRLFCKAMSNWRVFHFHDTATNAPIRHAQPLRDNLLLRADGGNLAPWLEHLRERHSDSYRQILSTVRLAAPYFGDFVHRDSPGHQVDLDERVDLEWFERDVGPGTTLGPRQLSDGTLRFLALVTALCQPTQLQPEPILIDEPELGLHPFALGLLAELLESVSKSRQVVVSTQSADLMSEFDASNIITVGRREGQSQFERPDEDRLDEWLDEYALGDLWRMNVIGRSPSR